MTEIYYVGYDAVHQSDFVYDVPNGHEFWILLLTQTPAEFLVDGVIQQYPKHSAVLYPPHHRIYYRACADTYVNDWVRFHSEESYITDTTLPLGIPISIPDPSYCRQLFQLLASENFFSADYRELTIDYLLRILFHKLLEASTFTHHTPHYQALLGLRKKIHSSPGYSWSVNEMASQLHFSSGYLQTLYKSTFGISCMDDVIECRIRLAKEKLIHGPQKIADIASMCGYLNVEHFSRQFRQLTGVTPREFRKSSSTRAENNEEA